MRVWEVRNYDQRKIIWGVKGEVDKSKVIGYIKEKKNSLLGQEYGIDQWANMLGNQEI